MPKILGHRPETSKNVKGLRRRKYVDKMPEMVKVPKDEYEELQTLRKIISDPELLEQFLESEKAVKEGRTRPRKDL